VGEDTWKPTPGELREWISRYRLYDEDEPVLRYRLGITFELGFGEEFYLYDESGDEYRISVGSKGDHYIQYGSEKLFFPPNASLSSNL